MFRFGRSLLAFAGVLGLAICTSTIQADPVWIPDASFETDDLTVTGYTHTPSDWQVQCASAVNPARYSYLYSEGAITPADGVNVGYLNGNVSGARPWMYQVLGTNFEAGKDYTLQVAAAAYKNAIVQGQTLSVELGYWTGTPPVGVDTVPYANDNPTIVAERLIQYNEVTVTSFANFSCSTGTLGLSDAAVGKPITVWIGTGAGSALGSAGVWYIDNFQLSSIPEPGTLVLLATGLIGLLAYAWRKRKCVPS